MMSPRENLLETLRCGRPEWVPVCLHLFPNENPTEGIPEELRDVIGSSSGNLARAILGVGEYLGARDHLLPVSSPAGLVSDTCSTGTERVGTRALLTTLSTPKGDLRQVTETREGYPGMVTERYVKTADDAAKLAEYFASLRVEVSPDALARARNLRSLMGDRGILFCRGPGTPLGMCYRIYSDIVNLIYLIADAPATMGDLFASMEEKYIQLHEALLRAAPEIDLVLGMDDTSTTLISPRMFDVFNVALTNRRADLCHAHGRMYMHHSCGLLRNLLPVYRKTRIDGVDAYTPPPIGDVGHAEGRKLLGPRYSMISGLASGLPSVREDAVRRHVAERFEDARAAGNVVFLVGGAELSFPAMELVFAAALGRSRSSRPGPGGE
ncbi:MAG: hypothetical protein HY321_07090 [Armatimonadetes bacterium]|nr:hypothetical protein [Armatimonadota bacterium]